MEAAANVFRCIAPKRGSNITHASILTDSINLPQKVKGGMESLSSDNARHISSKTPTALAMLGLREVTEHIDWRGTQSPQAACVSWDV